LRYIYIGECILNLVLFLVINGNILIVEKKSIITPIYYENQKKIIDTIPIKYTIYLS